jgi:hypothetical protein
VGLSGLKKRITEGCDWRNVQGFRLEENLETQLEVVKDLTRICLQVALMKSLRNVWLEDEWGEPSRD